MTTKMVMPVNTTTPTTTMTTSIKKIKVIPRSSQNSLGLAADGSYKVKLTAAPVDGEANKKLIDFLSDEWHIPKSHITIIKGHSSKTKLLEIKQ